MKAHLEQVLGIDETHLLRIPSCGTADRKLLPLAVTAFTHLRSLCAKQGIDLAVASSYRSFKQQQSLWNEKFNGLRPVLDDVGNEIDVMSLSERDRVFAILRWSALPGASRHHWGGDLDVYDLAALEGGYEIQLIPEEYAKGGPFEKLGAFFNECFNRGDLCEFYRPYAVDLGGVGVEPWHISHRPLAIASKAALNFGALAKHINASQIAGKDVVLENLDEIWRRFIAVD